MGKQKAKQQEVAQQAERISEGHLLTLQLAASRAEATQLQAQNALQALNMLGMELRLHYGLKPTDTIHMQTGVIGRAPA